jgi:X-X-X-Leu-X-X-Gly heptad repeat protein
LRKRPDGHGNVNGAQSDGSDTYGTQRTKLEKMTNSRNEDKEEQAAEEATETNSGLGLSPTQVIAGGGAAAVASVIGGHLGLAGTVVGAFILSVISAVALPLFRASLEKSHAQIKRVMPGRVTDATRTMRPGTASNTASSVRATSGKVSSMPLPVERTRQGLAGGRHAPRQSPRGRKGWVAVSGTALIFLVGVGSILGFQAVTGHALSNGTGALQSGVSQVVSNSNDSTSTPTPKPKPSAPAVEPSTVQTDPATDATEQPTSTATPTSTGHPTPSQKQTAPAGAGTPTPSSTPHPAVTSVGAVPAK